MKIETSTVQHKEKTREMKIEISIDQKEEKKQAIGKPTEVQTNIDNQTVQRKYQAMKTRPKQSKYFMQMQQG